MPSEPLRSFSSPCSRMPRDLANSSCLSLSWSARSSSPILRFSSDMHFVEKGEVVAEEHDGTRDR